MIASCINTLSRCVSSGVISANVCTCAPISSALRATTSNNSLSAFVTFNSIQSPVRPIGTVSRLIVTGLREICAGLVVGLVSALVAGLGLMVLGLTCVEPCVTACGFPLGKPIVEPCETACGFPLGKPGTLVAGFPSGKPGTLVAGLSDVSKLINCLLACRAEPSSVCALQVFNCVERQFIDLVELGRRQTELEQTLSVFKCNVTSGINTSAPLVVVACV